ncbi:LamG-like jellyroll fold domain-containing protein [Pontibacter sp. G13]|uniref:LamG-like jellyroll fold domain-containing protein n=1 Tax=Pontibacter sp. G13 TaxID=3074898 RepID=UPI00288A82E5|nr:LamG-like jellyroll fold domain-containing protein [Pontibacter sp. G13]WNJ20636.1 LamG-like jellyroll fold domain-containing protein [Pontibacter sp. G13]
MLFSTISSRVIGQSDTIFHYAFEGNLNNDSGTAGALVDNLGNGFAFDQEGFFGQALSLNGAQYLSLVEYGLLDPSISAYTVCAWVKNTSSPNHGSEHIVLHQSKNIDESGASRYFLGLNTSTIGVPLAVGTFVGGDKRSSATPIIRGEWTHIAIVGNPADQSFRFYVNGRFDNSTTAANAFEASQGGFRVGGHISGNLGKSWEGLIDDLYLIRKALTEAKIQAVAKVNTTSLSHLTSDQIEIFPNPFQKTFRVRLLQMVQAEIQVFDLNGRMVSEERVPAGTSEILLDGEAWPDGPYHLTLQIEDQILHRMLVKR